MSSSIEKPLVTIITACRNNVMTIEDTLRSVLAQTYPFIEYIVIDAKSTDGTSEVIDKYLEEISLLIREDDQGIADAWNKGIAKASGDIIGIINADDVYLYDAVEKAVNELTSNKEFGFVFGNLDIVDKQKKCLYTLEGDPHYARTIQSGMPSIPHPTVFMRADVYRQFGGFDLSYRTALDYEFLLRIYKCGVYGKYLNEKLVIMMLGGESDCNYVRAHKEVARASVKYGGNLFIANVRLCFKICKSFLRRTLEKMHLGIVGTCYRKLFGRQYSFKKET